MNATPRFPNARAHLRRVRTAPSTPRSETSMVIWLRGSEFRVRDESGRPSSDLLGDLTEARGFGILPRTIEGFMDAWNLSRKPPSQVPTELYGDLSSGEGMIREAGWPARPIDAGVIAPVAEQLLTDGRERDLEPVARATRLSRPCIEYRFDIDGADDAVPYRTHVRWLVSTPYVLLREIRDSKHDNLFALSEVVALEEGIVTDADLHPDKSDP